MGVRGVARPEAELARGCARSSGRGAFIVGTFDPHGNEDEEFLQHADMAFTVKYFPHYDSYLQGERAARMLVRAIRGDAPPPSRKPEPRRRHDDVAWMQIVGGSFQQ